MQLLTAKSKSKFENTQLHFLALTTDRGRAYQNAKPKSPSSNNWNCASSREIFKAKALVFEGSNRSKYKLCIDRTLCKQKHESLRDDGYVSGEIIKQAEREKTYCDAREHE